MKLDFSICKKCNCGGKWQIKRAPFCSTEDSDLLYLLPQKAKCSCFLNVDESVFGNKDFQAGSETTAIFIDDFLSETVVESIIAIAEYSDRNIDKCPYFLEHKLFDFSNQ